MGKNWIVHETMVIKEDKDKGKGVRIQRLMG